MQICGWRGPYWEHIKLCVPFLARFHYFGKIKVGIWPDASVCVSSLTTFEWLNQSSWNLVCTSWHLNSSHWCIFQIHPINYTNIAASQIFLDETLILLEWLYQSSWNLVCISCHLRPSRWCTSQIPPVSRTNTAAYQIIEVKKVNLSLCLTN
jgi:hypothetical protein